MKSEHLQQWVHDVDAEMLEEGIARPRKRRRLSGKRRANSDTEVDYSEPVADMPAKNKRAAMAPPESPVLSSSNKSRRSSEVDGPGSSSPSSSGEFGTTYPAYREKVLIPNGVIVECSTKPLSEHIRRALDQYERVALSTLTGTPLYSVMTVEQAASLIESLENCETNPEIEFCRHLQEQGLFPAPNVGQGLFRLSQQPFRGNGLPRSAYPLAFRPIKNPVPDYVYGYRHSVFGMGQRAAAQSVLYEPCMNLYWPFLIIEAKSQPKSGNSFQATNQCAGGGTIGINAIATLLTRASSALKGSDSIPQLERPGSAIYTEHPPEQASSSITPTSAMMPTIATPSQGSGGAQPQPHSQPQPQPQAQAQPAYPSPSEAATQDPDPDPHKINPQEAIVFSLAIDSMTASLYIHWRSEEEDDDGDSPSFHLQRIAVYMIVRPREVVELQIKLQGIVAWGMGPRLTAIKRALDVLIKDGQGGGRVSKY